MRVIEEVLITEDDLKLNVYRWLPENPRAAIVISHGWSEHAGRYQDVARRFVELGFEVHALDHRGHGKSDGLPGHVDDWMQYCDDLELFRGSIAVAPQYLLGHSMGGMISVLHTLRYPGKFKSLALSGPAMDVSYAVPFHKVMMSRMLSKVMPRLRFGGGIDDNFVCGDPDVVKAYSADPYNHGKVSARWFSEYLKLIETVKQQAGDIETPVGIWHGAHDELVAPWVGRQFFDLLRIERKQFKEVDDALHEILYEKSWPQTVDEMCAWFERENDAIPA